MQAELTYQDDFYKGTVILNVSQSLYCLNDVLDIQDGITYDQDGEEIALAPELKETALDAIAAKLHDQWGNGFGWEEKVSL